MNASCPTAEQLRSMLDDLLALADRQTIESHIESCQTCRDTLDALTQQTGLPAFAATLMTGRDTVTVGDLQAAPRFRFVRYHKGGGTSDVFEFWDEQLQRPVALKLPRQAACADRDRSRRFLKEAHVTAGLAHPGIVPVYALVEMSDGRTGCVMAFVQGKTLREAIDELHNRPSSPGEWRDARHLLRPLLTRFLALCATVAYAHSRQVLHRDIKPGNVILGVFGETVLIDWGLARRLDEHDDSQSDAAEIPTDDPAPAVRMSAAGGTVGFMSPEQTSPGAVVGPASDIFSLGATLYCLLTGQAPFPTPSTPQEADVTLRQVRDGDFARPRRVNAHVDRDLEAICLKAMAVQPGDRYAEASALASDIDRWLAGEPISARREPTVRRVWRWMRRHRVVTACAAATVLVALLASAVATPFLQAAYANEKVQRTRADAQRARANGNLKTSLFVMDYFLTRARRDPRATASSVAELRQYYLPQLVRFYEQLVANQADDSPDARQLVGRAYHGLGVCCALAGDRRQAEAHFLSAQAMHRQLAEEIDAATQQRVTHAADLAVTRIELAQLYEEMGRRQDAAALRQQITAAYDAFADRNHAYLFAVAVAHRFEDLGHSAEAIAWLGKVIEALEAVLRDNPEQPAVRTALVASLSTRALSSFYEHRFDSALHDWHRRSQLTAEPLPPDSRVYYAAALAQQRDHARAAAEADALASAGASPATIGTTWPARWRCV